MKPDNQNALTNWKFIRRKD